MNKENIMDSDIKYYYHRDKKNRPIVTVCEIKHNNKKARGVSICSPKDNPCKATGRKIAYDRARHALYRAAFGLLICRDEAVNQLMEVNYAAEWKAECFV